MLVKLNGTCLGRNYKWTLILIIKNFQCSIHFSFLHQHVNFDFPITRFLAIRGGVGYQFTFGSDWEIANGKELKNVSSGLNGDGFIIQTGILIGLFAF